MILGITYVAKEADFLTVKLKQYLFSAFDVHLKSVSIVGRQFPSHLLRRVWIAAKESLIQSTFVKLCVLHLHKCIWAAVQLTAKGWESQECLST